jgi:dolichol-phosphate mannosyltransferase
MRAAIITTRNEESTIGPLVLALKPCYDVLVIDDASEDDTSYVALGAGASVKEHLLRTGIGPSLVEGWRWALRRGAESIVQLDAGGSHDPGEAGRLVSALQDFDMVIGSRFLPGSRYIGNRKRASLSRLAAGMCNNRQVKPRFTDWTSGYRAFRADALEALIAAQYATTMHSWQIEVLREAIRRGLRIGEAPITYHAGRSSFNRAIARDAVGVWRTL